MSTVGVNAVPRIDNPLGTISTNGTVSGYRVYQIAKALGVTSREFVNFLQDRGHFVRSASSLVEPPIYAETMMAAFQRETGAIQ